MLSIWSSFADLPDPRTGNAQRHNLLDVLTIALTATICGAESCVDFADFARDRETLFRDFLELPGGLPSHDTFSRLFRLLDPVAFAACIAQFLDGLGEAGPGVIAIDGKTMRRSFDRAAGRSALHVVTAFAADARMVVGQVAAGDKESEIIAARALLGLLDLKGALVTGDGRRCTSRAGSEMNWRRSPLCLCRIGAIGTKGGSILPSCCSRAKCTNAVPRNTIGRAPRDRHGRVPTRSFGHWQRSVIRGSVT